MGSAKNLDKFHKSKSFVGQSLQLLTYPKLLSALYEVEVRVCVHRSTLSQEKYKKKNISKKA